MNDILKGLNDKQYEAVVNTEGPCLVIAGAGSGKTKVLTHKIAYLMEEKDVKPWNILAITFTNKAANEMKERINRMLHCENSGVQISTIHSLCVKILRFNIDKIGYQRNFEIIDDEDVQKILTDIFKKEDIDKKAFSTKVAAKMIGDYKNGMGKLNGVISQIYTQYEAYLKQNNFLDFDDLLIKTEELFKNHQDVLDYYQRLYHYILVDEFQDVNKVQYSIVKMLAGALGNLFVVGDDDQSIYSFRGASPDNMLNFTKDFPNAKVFKLLKNYRSHNSILKGANAVIKNNQIREPKQLYSDIEGSLNDVIIQEAYYYEAEVRFVVNEIAHLVRSNGLNYSDIAVLYRNSAISRNFEMAFIEERIPYNIFGGFSYLKRKEIKDIISYFRFICDPNRITHFKRIINITSKGIGDKTIAKVVAYDKKDNGLRAIIIEYSVNEKFYQITSNHYSNDPEKLDSEIKIKYNPKNHGEMIWIDNNRNGKYLASGIILLVGDIAIWFIINLKDKKKKDSKSLDDTKSLTPIPEDVKPEEIKEEPVEEKKEESL